MDYVDQRTKIIFSKSFKDVDENFRFYTGLLPYVYKKCHILITNWLLHFALANIRLPILEFNMGPDNLEAPKMMTKKLGYYWQVKIDIHVVLL